MACRKRVYRVKRSIQKALRLLFFWIAPLSATEYSPWLSPLWEFQGQSAYLFEHEKKVQSSKGDFAAPSHNHTLYGSLSITPWPYWNTEIELFCTRTQNIPFSYRAACGTLRYQWL